MGSHIVQAAPGGEGGAALQPPRLYERPDPVLQRFAHVKQGDPRLDDAAHVLPHLQPQEMMHSV